MQHEERKLRGRVTTPPPSMLYIRAPAELQIFSIQS
jgi:hypothetical protein